MLPKAIKQSSITYILIFSIVGTFVLAALYFLAGRPAFKYADDMRRRFELYQDRLQKAEELIHSVANPQQALEDIERRMMEFEEKHGSSRQSSRIVQELGQSTIGRPISVISITPKEDIKTASTSLPPGVKKLFFEMVMSASYQQIGEYARHLSGLPGFFTIESFTIERQDANIPNQADKTGALKATFIIATYIVGAP